MLLLLIVASGGAHGLVYISLYMIDVARTSRLPVDVEISLILYFVLCHGLESLLPQHRDDTAYPALALFIVTHLHKLFVASHNRTTVQSFNSSCPGTPTVISPAAP
jgi:hypothetical protein